MTRSTPDGAATAKSTSDTIKPVVLELGCKNASIVFDDAEFGRAVRDTFEGAFFNKGEACTVSSRLLVQKGHLRALYRKAGCRDPPGLWSKMG